MSTVKMEVIHRFEQFYENLSLSSIENLGDIYHSEIVFMDPVSNHQGLHNVKQYFTKLLENTTHCNCKIQATMGMNNQFSVTWKMRYGHPKLNSGREIIVDGITHLKHQDDRIILHRDYFDMGQMIYEQVPILGFVVKRIKNRMHE